MPLLEALTVCSGRNLKGRKKETFSKAVLKLHEDKYCLYIRRHTQWWNSWTGIIFTVLPPKHSLLQKEILVGACNLNQAMEGFSIKDLPGRREILCLLPAVRFTISLCSYIPCLARDASLTKTTTKCSHLKNQYYSLASSNYQSIGMKYPSVLRSFKSKSFIVINNAVAKGSFSCKGQGRLLLVHAKGQFSQTHPALNSHRGYSHTLCQQGAPRNILPG